MKALSTALAVSALGLSLVAVEASAHGYKKNGIEIIHPWTKEGSGDTAEVYLTIRNTGKKPETLTGASSFAADKVELRQPDAASPAAVVPAAPIVIPAGASSVLSPASARLVATGLKQARTAYGHVPVTLEFARAGKINIEVMVEEAPDSAD